jgi:hypothetical protein
LFELDEKMAGPPAACVNFLVDACIVPDAHGMVDVSALRYVGLAACRRPGPNINKLSTPISGRCSVHRLKRI